MAKTTSLQLTAFTNGQARMVSLTANVFISILTAQKSPKQRLPGGSYAIIRRTVSDPAQYRAYWEEIMAAVIAAQLEIDNRPCFEHYHHYDDASGVADVSFCVAVAL